MNYFKAIYSFVFLLIISYAFANPVDPINLGIESSTQDLKRIVDFNQKENFFFWKYASSMDLVVNGLYTNDSHVQPVLDSIISAYYPVVDDWFDDFEWWSIFAQRVLSKFKLVLTASEINMLLHIENDAWSLAQYGKSVWNECMNTQKCASKYKKGFSPTYVGGTWDTYFLGSRTVSKRSTPAVDPLGVGLGARENTVTNMMYAVYTAREDNWNDTIHTFIKQWIAEKNPARNFINKLSKDRVLVRERVYKPSDKYYNPNLAWAGDQGITLGYLLSIINRNSSDSSVLPMTKDDAINLAKNIIKGSEECFISEEGLILPWVHSNACKVAGYPPGNDYEDYNMGIGVLVNYLTQAYRENKILRDFIKSTKFPSIIKTEAEIMAGPDGRTLNSTCTKSCSELVDISNKLSLYYAEKIMTSP